MATTKTKRPTPDQMAQRAAALEKKRKLERDARKLGDVISAIDLQVVDWLHQTGKTAAKIGDARCSLEMVPGRVSWKDELVAIWPADKPLPVAEDTEKLVYTQA